MMVWVPVLGRFRLHKELDRLHTYYYISISANYFNIAYNWFMIGSSHLPTYFIYSVKKEVY